MTYSVIDMYSFPRKAHFDYFRTLGNPYMGVTADVDLTELVNACRAAKRSFYLAFMHAASLAADSVEELRYRIKDGGIVCYDSCCTSHVELLENGTYCYCTLEHEMQTDEYFEYAEKQRQACRANGSIKEDDNVERSYFISTLPWLKYTALIQPTGGGDESNPRITWGKYEKNFEGRLMMPLTILAHHSLADGMHIARLYENVDREMKKLSDALA